MKKFGVINAEQIEHGLAYYTALYALELISIALIEAGEEVPEYVIGQQQFLKSSELSLQKTPVEAIAAYNELLKDFNDYLFECIAEQRIDQPTFKAKQEAMLNFVIGSYFGGPVLRFICEDEFFASIAEEALKATQLA